MPGILLSTEQTGNQGCGEEDGKATALLLKSWQENEWMIAMECGRCDDRDMLSTVRAQRRNRVGKREWTLPQTGEVFIEKGEVFMWLEVGFWLMSRSYQGLRDRVQKRETSWSTDIVLLSKKDLQLRRCSVECWGNLEWREKPGQSCGAWGAHRMFAVMRETLAVTINYC